MAAPIRRTSRTCTPDGQSSTRLRLLKSASPRPFTFAHELRHRILKPLRLAHTQLATTRHVARLSDAGTNPNLPWAAGGIVSDGADLARFHSALLSGRLL